MFWYNCLVVSSIAKMIYCFDVCAKNQILSFLPAYGLCVHRRYTRSWCLIIHCKNQTRTIDKCFRVPPSMNICFSYIKDVNDDEELTWECFDIILSFKNSLGSNTLFSQIHALIYAFCYTVVVATLARCAYGSNTYSIEEISMIAFGSFQQKEKYKITLHIQHPTMTNEFLRGHLSYFHSFQESVIVSQKLCSSR